MKYHPDTKKDGTIVISDENRFHEISEAWSVLSRPDVRANYDRERFQLKYTSINPGYPGGINNQQYQPNSDVGESGHSMVETHRQNYVNLTKVNASSNWQETQNKYRTDQWQNMPLSERKTVRHRPLASGTGFILGKLMPAVLIVSVGAYLYMNRPHLRK